MKTYDFENTRGNNHKKLKLLINAYGFVTLRFRYKDADDVYYTYNLE